MDEAWRLRRDEGYGVCTDAVTRLACIFASQKYNRRHYFPFSKERVTRLACIFASQKLKFGSGQPSPPTVHRTVGFHFRAIVTA